MDDPYTCVKEIESPDWCDFYVKNRRMKNDGRGDCFFLSILQNEHLLGEKMTSYEKTVAGMREVVTGYVLTLPQQITHLDEEETFNTHIGIVSEKEWVTDWTTLLAISEMYNTEIHVFDTRTPGKVIIIGDSTRNSPQVIPLYLSGGHYEAMDTGLHDTYLDLYSKVVSENLEDVSTEGVEAQQISDDEAQQILDDEEYARRLQDDEGPQSGA